MCVSLAGTLCFASGKPAKKWTYWGRSYWSSIVISYCGCLVVLQCCEGNCSLFFKESYSIITWRILIESPHNKGLLIHISSFLVEMLFCFLRLFILSAVIYQIKSFFFFKQKRWYLKFWESVFLCESLMCLAIDKLLSYMVHTSTHLR